MSDRDSPKEEEAIAYKQPSRRSRFKPGRSGNRNGRPNGAKSHRQVVENVAGEIHSVVENGEPRRRSTLELVLLSLRNRTFDGHVSAYRLFRELLERYGVQEPSEDGGYLIMPEPLTEEEWCQRYANPPPESHADPARSLSSLPTKK